MSIKPPQDPSPSTVSASSTSASIAYLDALRLRGRAKTLGLAAIFINLVLSLIWQNKFTPIVGFGVMLVMLGIAMSFYARSKGYHPMLGVLALLSIVGIFVLLWVPGKIRPPAGSPAALAEEAARRRTLIITLSFFALIIVVAIMTFLRSS